MASESGSRPPTLTDCQQGGGGGGSKLHRNRWEGGAGLLTHMKGSEVESWLEGDLELAAVAKS